MAKYVRRQKGVRPESDYERYLCLNELLSLQPGDHSEHHDELLFQIVHQVCELWWKETAFELRAIRRFLQQSQVSRATHLLQRVTHIQHLLMETIRLLETMRPWDFQLLRQTLGYAGGVDSPGFRTLMHLSPLLWDDFLALLAQEGIPLVEVYMDADRFPALLSLAETLLDYDERFQLFRAQHFKLAGRMIGFRSVGTAGISLERLEHTLQDMFYPELWEVRNQLTCIADNTHHRGRQDDKGIVQREPTQS